MRGVSGGTGLIKLFSIIVGAVAVGLTAHVYNDIYTAEKFYLGVTSVALGISCILLALGMMDIWGENWPKFDSLIHALLAVLLFIGAVLMSVSVSDHWNSLITASNWRTKRALAPTFGFINVLLYVILAFRILNRD